MEIVQIALNLHTTSLLLLSLMTSFASCPVIYIFLYPSIPAASNAYVSHFLPPPFPPMLSPILLTYTPGLCAALSPSTRMICPLVVDRNKH